MTTAPGGPLWDQLLDQADELVEPPEGEPSDADLRRAVSAAYYALFHRVTDVVAADVAGPLDEEVRRGLRRLLEHGSMKRVFDWIESDSAPKARPAAATLVAAVRGGAPAIVPFATEFKELQEQRHAADYDHAVVIGADDAVEAIGRADAAIDVIETLPAPTRQALSVLMLAYGNVR